MFSILFVIPYPPGFPILVSGQAISRDVIAFVRALDVKEMHDYRAELGLRVFTVGVLAQSVKPALKARGLGLVSAD